MERPCNTLKIVSWTKKSFHFGLLVGFLVLSATALRDLYSGTKTIQVNKIKQEFITNFPSFSVCSENFNITQKSLHNGVLNNEPFKVQVHTGFKYKSKKKWIIDIDMQNQSALMDHLDGEWDTYCKSFTMYTPACIPCLTFRFNSYKRQDVEKAYFAIHKTQNSIDEHGVLLTLHERNQSLLLHDSFDWSHSLYLQYRSGLKFHVSHSALVTDKSYFSNCTNEEGFNPDEEMIRTISQNINCSIPWSSSKVPMLQECRSESDFENYLTALDDLQDSFKEVGKKCDYKQWKLYPIIEQPSDAIENASIVCEVIWSSEDSITVEKETYVYTPAYFIGTIGGYLGLFLGGSILGYLDYIESFITRKLTSVPPEIQT